MSKISPYYRVNVINQLGELVYAHLEEAEKSDMPPISKQDWTFNWQGFWKQADFECEALVKLTHQGKILGLIRFGLYPFPHKQTPEFVYVSHLQCVRKAHQAVNPVGFWLLWYVAQIALESCAGNSQESILVLRGTPATAKLGGEGNRSGGEESHPRKNLTTAQRWSGVGDEPPNLG